jgi:hypothetical protein
MTDSIEPRDREVLSVLVAHGGSATSSEIRDRLDWMDKSSQSSYRLDKLDNMGVLETTDGVVGREAVAREAELTDKGRNVVDELNITAKEPSIEARLNKIEAKNKSLQKQNACQRAVLDEIERIFNDLGVEYDTTEIMKEHLETIK